jgi:hypothetical protein
MGSQRDTNCAFQVAKAEAPVKEVAIANPYKYLYFLDNIDPVIDGQARGRREARNLRNWGRAPWCSFVV